MSRVQITYTGQSSKLSFSYVEGSRVISGLLVKDVPQFFTEEMVRKIQDLVPPAVLKIGKTSLGSLPDITQPVKRFDLSDLPTMEDTKTYIIEWVEENLPEVDLKSGDSKQEILDKISGAMHEL